ncbi:MAG: Holliday junction resolvase RuvX [Muribaculaceae bacterium]|nr:Holliday junction resolvase RuvX [Muribaculaceae bacterium]
MARILAIDYGRKRCGIAVTDTLQIIANGLPTVPTHQLMDFLKEYCGREEVEMIIVGEPRQMDGTPSESARYIEPFLKRLAKEMPDMRVIRRDERFTSVIAHREMIAAGFRKSQRQEKGRADEMSAVIILTEYLQNR